MPLARQAWWSCSVARRNGPRYWTGSTRYQCPLGWRLAAGSSGCSSQAATSSNWSRPYLARGFAVAGWVRGNGYCLARLKT